MSSLLVRGFLFSLVPVLAAAACGTSSGSGNPRRVQPLATSTRDSEVKSLRIAPFTETTVSVSFSECINDAQVESMLFVRDNPAMEDPRPTRVKANAGGCSKTVEVSLPALPPTEFGLKTTARQGGRVIGTRTLDITVGDGDSPQPTERPTTKPGTNPTPETQPTDAPDASWPGEPAPDTMCNGVPCASIIKEFVERSSLNIAQHFGTLEPVGTIKFTPTSANDASNGTFEIKGRISWSLFLTSGEYSVRNGRLALRSFDKKETSYFRYYPVNSNGIERQMLFGEMRFNDESSPIWLM